MDLKKLAAKGLPLSLVAVFLSLNVGAYEFSSDYKAGIYWLNFPVTLEPITDTIEDANFLQPIIDEAVTDWEQAVGKDIWSISPMRIGTTPVGNFIKWSMDIGGETGFDPNRTMAVTIRYNSGTFFERAVIILNGKMNYLRTNFGNSLKKTILHELGHTVGLDHSTELAIMGPSLSAIGVLQTDDIRGMTALIDDSIYKAQTGFVAEVNSNALDDGSSGGGCGSVEYINQPQLPSNNGEGQGHGHGRGVFNFLMSLFVGFIFFYSLRYSVHKLHS